MNGSGLTRRQSAALEYIKAYIAERGHSPSYEEIMKAIGLQSKNGIHRIVCALEERGLIIRLRSRARSIIVVESELAAIIGPELAQRLQDFARATKIPTDTILRWAVDEYIGSAGTRSKMTPPFECSAEAAI